MMAPSTSIACGMAISPSSSFLNGLRNDRLAVSRRAVDEHRVPRVDGRAELIEHALADDQMLERVADAVARGGAGRGLRKIEHVAPVLLERHRRDADVVVRFQEQRRPRTPGVRDAVAVRRPADHGAAGDLDLPLRS